MSSIKLASDTLNVTPNPGEIEYNGQFSATDSTGYRALIQRIELDTPITASGTAVEFLNIPSWAKRITVMFNGVSVSSTNLIKIQLGSTTYNITGYNCVGVTSINSSIGSTGNITGFVLGNSNQVGTYTYSGAVTICNISGNNYTATGGIAHTTANVVHSTFGSIDMSGTVDRLRIISSSTGSPADTFDAGTINLLIEG